MRLNADIVHHSSVIHGAISSWTDALGQETNALDLTATLIQYYKHSMDANHFETYSSHLTILPHPHQPPSPPHPQQPSNGYPPKAPTPANHPYQYQSLRHYISRSRDSSLTSPRIRTRRASSRLRPSLQNSRRRMPYSGARCIRMHTNF